MPRAKASLLVILTTALAVAVLFLLPYTPAQVVHTEVAQRGNLVRTQLFRGTVGYACQQPCVSLLDGQIREVHVSAGQKVRKGDLILSMDTSVQEEALYALHKQAYEQASRLNENDALAVLAAQQTLEWEKARQELEKMIQMAQVRAGMDGIVEAVYAEPGAYVTAGSALGNVRSSERCVLAAIQPADSMSLEEDMLALLEFRGEILGSAFLEKRGLLRAEALAAQQAAFLPFDQEVLADCAIGDAVTVRVLQESAKDQVLIPLSAVDVFGKVWYVDNGRAKAEKIDVSKRSEDFAAASSEWEGRQVILSPEGLYENCRVKEADMH